MCFKRFEPAVHDLSDIHNHITKLGGCILVGDRVITGFDDSTILVGDERLTIAEISRDLVHVKDLSNLARRRLFRLYHPLTSSRVLDDSSDFRARLLAKYWHMHCRGYVLTLDGRLQNVARLIANGVPADRIVLIEMLPHVFLYEKIVADLLWQGCGPHIILGEICDVVLQQGLATYGLTETIEAIYLDFLGLIPHTMRKLMVVLQPTLKVCAVTKSHRRPRDPTMNYKKMVGPPGFQPLVKVPQHQVKTWFYSPPGVHLPEPREWLIRNVLGHKWINDKMMYKVKWDYTPDRNCSRREKKRLTIAWIDAHDGVAAILAYWRGRTTRL